MGSVWYSENFEILAAWDTKAWEELVTILTAYSSECHFWGRFACLFKGKHLADAVAKVRPECKLHHTAVQKYDVRG